MKIERANKGLFPVWVCRKCDNYYCNLPFYYTQKCPECKGILENVMFIEKKDCTKEEKCAINRS